MKVLELNSLLVSSTGKIVRAISDTVRNAGGECLVAVADSRTNRKIDYKGCMYVGDIISRNLNIELSSLLGLDSFFSIISTFRLVRHIRKFDPDVIHLHNLHGGYLNLHILFRYLRKCNKKIIWTFHDCWPFTGHCPYFTSVNCSKWRDGCYSCPQLDIYPSVKIDRTRFLWNFKKRCFSNLNNMTIVTPSKWLADLVSQSFLKQYNIKVINNGIDLDVFKPTSSDFRKRYGLEQVPVLLGVAFDWGYRKGLDVFIQLAKDFNDRYKIVLIGTTPEIVKTIPENVICISKTNNQKELAEIYSAADLFINPTREDNYPTVNMEAIACGTPVITFDTGGSAEMIGPGCGCSVPVDDVSALEHKIDEYFKNKLFSRDACLAYAQIFNQTDKYYSYLDLFE